MTLSSRSASAWRIASSGLTLLGAAALFVGAVPTHAWAQG